MRIIGGKYKGVELLSLKGGEIRPTTDRIRENIFNLIKDYVSNGDILDLFCGTGALGIEALSRGARNCVFSDINYNSVKITGLNLENIHLNSQIIQNDWKQILSYLEINGKSFNVIFLDPPYNKIDLYEVINCIYKKKILKEEGVIVVEKSVSSLPHQIPKGIYQVDCRNYGNTSICLYALGHAVAITGTFNPFTIGHEYLVEKALEFFKSVHVVILRNPEKMSVSQRALEKRVRAIRSIVRKYDSKIQVECYEGLAVDYCKKHDIKYIIRGLRNEHDLEYEREIANFNADLGGIETFFIMAKDSNISSTKVREMMTKHEDVSSFLPKE